MKAFRGASALTCMLLAACTTPSDPPAPYSLDDTDWVLIGYQSSNSEELTEVRLNDYTMHLATGGTAHFKFDCNRGTSSWRGVSSAGRGTLSFGNIAATTALCGPDSIGERLSKDLTRVSQYTLDDGKLTTSGPDGVRLYVWDRVD